MTRRTNEQTNAMKRHPVDADGAGASTRRARERGLETPAGTYRALLINGFTPDEAGNLVALASGLRPVHSGWRLREIEALLFLRGLFARGRGADDLPAAA